MFVAQRVFFLLVVYRYTGRILASIECSSQPNDCIPAPAASPTYGTGHTQMLRTMKALFSIALCLVLSSLTIPATACHLSKFTLDSVVQNGSNYDIYVQLCIGGGPGGADDDTRNFQIAFYSSGSLSVLSYTPQLTSSISTTYDGFDLGPDNYPAGAANILYTDGCFFPACSRFECISATSCGGSAHQVCRQIIFTLDAQPDSIRALAIEGNGNPTAGCYPDTDMIIYLAGSPPPLPVEMTAFTARPLADGQVQLNWETAQEINVNRFEILRSKDGIHYDLVNTVTPCGTCAFSNSYEYFDKPESPGTWYYRIMTVDNDNSVDHSPTVSVTLGTGQALRLAPNPAAGSTVEFTIYGIVSLEQEAPQVQVHNLQGQLIWSGQAMATGDGTARISLENQLRPGMYLVSLRNRPGEHLKLLVER